MIVVVFISSPKDILIDLRERGRRERVRSMREGKGETERDINVRKKLDWLPPTRNLTGD